MTVINRFSSFYTDLASMQISELSHIYSDDVLFIDPIAEHRGINAVEKYFDKLLHNAKHCRFDIHTKENTEDDKFIVTWTMEFTSSRMKNGNPIRVDGLSHLQVADNKITFHRDYYDLGQMIYENVPILGRIVKKIKRGLA
ncbi:nuclear transport factor 2 family protein [Glaciecola petra]|uniref:Nuclear transport factor 2 family protein n=1 Tax=Glaciecola petra TaxID=3075602 RepID=A0ABU2ZT06_9ALTE|nr:nuclear transport factor 2 family protein [Aestuariibacter sp. P117]MDT0595771.1 nuclear transport factor 2 family protein [Aestuariibacter sp. P117]